MRPWLAGSELLGPHSPPPVPPAGLGSAGGSVSLLGGPSLRRVRAEKAALVRRCQGVCVPLAPEGTNPEM